MVSGQCRRLADFLNVAGGLNEGLLSSGVDEDLATPIVDSLENYNLAEFESLVTALYRNSSTDVTCKVQRLLSTQFEMILKSSSIINLLDGGSGIGLMTVGASALGLVVAVLFFPCSMLLSVVSRVLIVVGVLFGLHKWIFGTFSQSFLDVQKNLSKVVIPQISEEVAVAAAPSFGPVVLALMNKAGCQPEQVSQSVQDAAVTLNSLRAMHVVVEGSSSAIASLEGALAKVPDAEPWGLGKNAGDVKKELKQLVASVDELQDGVTSRINGAAVLARICQQTEADIVGLSDTMNKEHEKKWQPDWSLGPAESKYKKKRDETFQEDALEVTKSCLKELRKLPEFAQPDQDAIKRQSIAMIKALAYSPQMAASEQAAIEAAIEDRHKLNDEFEKINSRVTQEKCLLADSEAQENNAQWKFDTDLVALDHQLNTYIDIIKSGGVGTMKMTGTPPADNPHAQEIYRLFMNGSFDQLTKKSDLHVSGRFGRTIFSFSRSGELTDRQKKHLKLKQEVIEKIDDLKKKHTEAMAKIVEQRNVISANMPTLNALLEEAKKRVNEGKAKNDSSTTYAQFRMTDPVRAGHIEMMFKFNAYISKIAQWMFNPVQHTNALSFGIRAIQDAAECDAFSRPILRRNIQSLVQTLGEVDHTPLAFLRALTEQGIKQQCKPMIQGDPDAAQRELEDFEKATVTESATAILLESATAATVVD
jgi:hypothetical protein